MDQPAQAAGPQAQPDMTVKIERTGGKYSVGVDSGDTDEAQGADQGAQPGAQPTEAQEDSGMQEVGSVDEALKIASDLLTNPQAQQAEAQQGFNQVFSQGQ